MLIQIKSVFVLLISPLLNIGFLKFLCLPHTIRGIFCGVGTRILKIWCIEAEIWAKQKFKCKIVLSTPFTSITIPILIPKVLSVSKHQHWILYQQWYQDSNLYWYQYQYFHIESYWYQKLLQIQIPEDIYTSRLNAKTKTRKSMHDTNRTK